MENLRTELLASLEAFENARRALDILDLDISKESSYIAEYTSELELSRQQIEARLDKVENVRSELLKERKELEESAIVLKQELEEKKEQLQREFDEWEAESKIKLIKATTNRDVVADLLEEEMGNAILLQEKDTQRRVTLSEKKRTKIINKVAKERDREIKTLEKEREKQIKDAESNYEHAIQVAHKEISNLEKEHQKSNKVLEKAKITLQKEEEKLEIEEASEEKKYVLSVKIEALKKNVESHQMEFNEIDTELKKGRKKLDKTEEKEKVLLNQRIDEINSKARDKHMELKEKLDTLVETAIEEYNREQSDATAQLEELKADWEEKIEDARNEGITSLNDIKGMIKRELENRTEALATELERLEKESITSIERLESDFQQRWKTVLSRQREILQEVIKNMEEKLIVLSTQKDKALVRIKKEKPSRYLD